VFELTYEHLWKRYVTSTAEPAYRKKVSNSDVERH